jgi:hypothetical protein
MGTRGVRLRPTLRPSASKAPQRQARRELAAEAAGHFNFCASSQVYNSGVT